jgi:hypothetical protein
MNQEAIEKLKQFQIKNHLSGYNLQEPQGEQTDKVSESSGKKINYPDHIKPLKDRIMSALLLTVAVLPESSRKLLWNRGQY